MTLAEILTEAERRKKEYAASTTAGERAMRSDSLKRFYANNGRNLLAVVKAAVEMREAEKRLSRKSISPYPPWIKAHGEWVRKQAAFDAIVCKEEADE